MSLNATKASLKDTDLKDYPDKSNSCLKSEKGATSREREHAYHYPSQQQKFTTGYNYCDFIVCGFNEQIAFFCERILPDICHWKSVVPKLNHFWRYCVPEILGRWYTQKRNVPQPSCGISSVCFFCRMNTTDAVVTCSNQACPISSFHLACLKVPKTWFCLLCQETAAARNEKSKGNQTQKILDEDLKLDCICVCNKKSLPSDKLLKCHNPLCENGQFFHLACLNFKRTPNKALTTWECMGCKSGGKGKLMTQRTLYMHASQVMKMSL